MNELVGKITDRYEREARLYPVLLALFPLIVMLGLLYGPKSTVLTGVVMLAASCGGVYLLTSVSRELGKRLETGLYKDWGGKPSTQLLRHRDARIEAVTKQRYHAFLSGEINTPFPSREQETANPQAADDIYESSVRWLLNQIRDTTKFGLLFNENIAYGFRRNALGLKPLGLASALISMAWVLLTQNEVIYSNAMPLFNVQTAVVMLPEPAIISLAVSMLMIVIWLLFFTRERVRSAAFAYAEMLLRACDVLDAKHRVSS
ncbi:MAG: hypothetical protein M0T85_05125 [Dehalococcoidales bacterium]|nr:hypothetical protein [Dehalococcoidales bacterium]